MRCRRPTRRARAQQEAIERLHGCLRIDLALYAPDGTLLAAAGRPLPPLELDAAPRCACAAAAAPGSFP